MDSIASYYVKKKKRPVVHTSKHMKTYQALIDETATFKSSKKRFFIKALPKTYLILSALNTFPQLTYAKFYPYL